MPEDGQKEVTGQEEAAVPAKRKPEDEPEQITKKLKPTDPEPDAAISAKSDSKDGYHDLPAQPLDEQWTSSKENLSETHLKIEGHPVMEKWETPYMGALAKKATENGGKVMEIGFGMGISATAVQQSSTLAEHIIIELNGDVYKRLLEFQKKYPKVTPMHGGWESQLEKIEDNCIDGILYDTYPLSKATQHVHQFAFVKEAKKKLRVGGILTYCNLTSLGVLRKKSEYNKTDLSDKENWSNLFRETQLPHLIAAGWNEDEISWDIFELPKKTIEDRDKIGCDYYTHNSCLVPHLERKK